MKKTKNIGVLTSGGDGPGMNAAIRASVRTAIYYGYKVFGIYQGYTGLIHDKITELTSRDVGGIINRGGTILQTSRCKEFREYNGRKCAFENMKKYDMNALIVIGGDGSFRGLHDLINEFKIQGIGLPGTIDNDLFGTDFTIGFDTAVNTALDAIDRIRDTATSHARLFIIEVMGRHSGYLAEYSGIGGGAEDILIPETITDIKKICDKLEKGHRNGKRSSILVVAEGDEAGNAFEIKKKIEKVVNWEIRVSILGHIQRGGSPMAIDRLIATRMGYEAVLAIKRGETDKMVGMDKDTAILTPLKKTWTIKKKIDPSLVKMLDILST
ncbi:MAG: 6-phosphofructokinase [Spirochaetes bacterium]|nr:6-phosphofructokinase [Spirochaetota bacterium]